MSSYSTHPDRLIAFCQRIQKMAIINAPVTATGAKPIIIKKRSSAFASPNTNGATMPATKNNAPKPNPHRAFRGWRFCNKALAEALWRGANGAAVAGDGAGF